ncbi:MAG: F0F1 ATP synthase subunit A [Endomicrobium sp.]|jgi:F-type H+-transporting ATPase subunit a|nr:F0F1 ATP synthase subunit A [Endomicrobium sp.]
MQLHPDILFSIFCFPVTNTIIATVLTDIVIIIMVIIVNRKICFNPNNIQNIIEAIIDYFKEITETIAGEKSYFIYHWGVSFFLFIVISNLLVNLPGFDSIKFCNTISFKHTELSLLRVATSDLNFTCALAVISIIATHFVSIQYIGIKEYFKKFITLKMFPIFLSVGFLELMNEFSKVISFSFRLFGNIFAGEKVISTIYNLYSLCLPVPFIILEIIVAIVQALVFSMLTITFMHIMTEKLH